MYSLSALFLLAQAPPWMFPLAAASVAALATLAAAGITLFATNRREQERLHSEERREQERLRSEEQRHRDKHKHESQEAWRVERKQAYAPFFALARHARQTLDWKTSQDSKAALLEDLREAHAAVVLVVKEDDLRRNAQAYYEVCKDILHEDILHEDIPHGKDLSVLTERYKDARNEFVNSARVEIGLEAQPWDW
jgi:hypothetical protein